MCEVGYCKKCNCVGNGEYCQHCGGELTPLSKCQKCGRELMPSWEFCTKCGAKIERKK